MPKAKKPIIEKNFEKFINSNFDKKDKRKTESLKFEWFVNSMHIWYSSSQFYNTNTKIGKSIALGVAQGGDAFFISVNGNERIFTLNDNIDDVIDYLKTKGKVVTFHFLQTKYSEDAGWAALLGLIEIPLKIWKGQDFSTSHPLLKKMQEFIDRVVDEDDPILGKIKHKIEIYLYTKKDQGNIESLKKTWRDNISAKIQDLEYYFGAGTNGDKNVKIELRGAEFLNSIYERLNSNSYSLIINKNELIEAEDKKYLIGYLTAKELLNSIAPMVNNSRSLYLDVFKNNIRLYLGETPVNEKIENTLVKEPGKFHHYNNGLTITTKEIKDSDNSKNFIITPVNIVNGCQTANSIFKILKAEGDDKLKEVKIPVKIIVAQDKEYENITIRTNTQNGLQEKDLVSITNLQKDLEDEFSKLKLMGCSFFYKRQKSDNEDLPDNVDFIIHIDDVLRAVFATLMLVPNKVSGYFDKTTGKYLDRIFEDRFIKLYLTTTALLKFVEDELGEDSNAKYNRLRYHICYLIYRFANKGEDIKLIENYFRSSSEEEREEEDLKLHAAIVSLSTNLYKIFGSRQKFMKVFNYILAKIDTNYPQLLDLSDRIKEKILYVPVQKLPRTKATPVFENFDTIFSESLDDVINPVSAASNGN